MIFKIKKINLINKNKNQINKNQNYNELWIKIIIEKIDFLVKWLIQ